MKRKLNPATRCAVFLMAIKNGRIVAYWNFKSKPKPPRVKPKVIAEEILRDMGWPTNRVPEIP